MRYLETRKGCTSVPNVRYLYLSFPSLPGFLISGAFNFSDSKVESYINFIEVIVMIGMEVINTVCSISVFRARNSVVNVQVYMTAVHAWALYLAWSTFLIPLIAQPLGIYWLFNLPIVWTSQ